MPSNVLEKEMSRSSERIQVEPETNYTKEVCETKQTTKETWVEVRDGYHIKTETVTEQECHTIEVTDGPEFRTEWTVDRNPGWNAGARTVRRVSGDFYFSFKVNPANRMGVGVGRTRTGNHYRDLPHAFYFVGDRFRVTETGGIVHGPLTFSRHDEFTILRIANEIIYKRNDAVIHRSQASSMGSMIGIAAIYMGGDRVI